MSASTWEACCLSDLVEVKHGFAFKSEYYRDEGPYVLLTPGNFFDAGGFRAKENEKYYDGPVPPAFLLDQGDLLVVMTEQAEGLLGSPAVIQRSDFYLHNQRLGKVLITCPERLDRRFLYHLFNTREVRSQIRATSNGAKVRHTSPGRIGEVRVLLPPLNVQRRIADILSAYDDLIENNTLRIAILEEMGRSLYREWFVNFRFPGHDDVRIGESRLGPLPDGWTDTILASLAQERRESIDPRRVDPSTPYVGLEHLPRRSIALTDWGEAGQVQSTKLRFKVGEILFGKIRPYFHKVVVSPIDGLCSSDAIVIRPVREEYAFLVLACVSSDDFVAHATQTSQGTKMPRANWDVLLKYPVALAPKPLLERFNGIIDPSVNLIQNLVIKNRVLRQTRDLLLPKLISGELSVEALDEKLVDAAGA